MLTINDIEQLRQLEDVSACLKVRFALHGGVAFRLALHQLPLEGVYESIVDLFDLTPFTADIDLLYFEMKESDDVRRMSAFERKAWEKKRTRQVLNEILKVVPNADCFRWEVRGARSQQAFDHAAAFEARIPARELRILANSNLNSEDAIEDIRARRFRFLRSKDYRQSPLFEKGCSLEVLSAILYMQTLFEARLTPAEWTIQPGRSTARTVFAEATKNETQAKLEQSVYLRRRLSYLLVNCIAAAAPETFWRVSSEYGLSDFLTWLCNLRYVLPDELRTFLNPDRQRDLSVLSPSSPLGPDRHRFPFATSRWNGEEHARRELSRVTASLADNHRILMISPIMRVSAGLANYCPQEFVYFVLPPNDHDLQFVVELGDRNLSILAIVRAWWWRFWPWKRWSIFSVPCVVQGLYGGNENLFIRANTLGLFNLLARFPGAETQFVLIGSPEKPIWISGDALNSGLPVLRSEMSRHLMLRT
jgi:hypothetical protein